MGNSKSAIIGAIEIYNKPRFEYRNEVFVQLLLNGWELLLKAVVSRSKRSIYYKKRRGEPYRTLSWSDAFWRAANARIWPMKLPPAAVGRNLELISIFRDNAVHFYNAPGFGVVVYSLAQTAIMNYRDLLSSVFGEELSDEISWDLLPLGIRAPIGPLEYLSGARPKGASPNQAVDDFLNSLLEATRDLDNSGVDTSRLLTIFDVSLQSTKRIEQADIVVGIERAAEQASVLVTNVLDPNRSHPYRRKDALERIGSPEGAFNSYSFDAIVWRYGFREQSHLCWIDESTGTVKWSAEIVTLIKRLSSQEVQEARASFSAHRRGSGWIPASFGGS